MHSSNLLLWEPSWTLMPVAHGNHAMTCIPGWTLHYLVGLKSWQLSVQGRQGCDCCLEPLEGKKQQALQGHSAKHRLLDVKIQRGFYPSFTYYMANEARKPFIAALVAPLP